MRHDCLLCVLQVTLFGEQFGLEDNILASRIGPTSCNSTVWQSDSIVSVTTAAGEGQQVKMVQ